MKTLLPIVALLLMAIGGGIALSKFRGPSDATKSASPPPENHPAAKTNRETGSKLSPEAAAKSLRALTTLSTKPDPKERTGNATPPAITNYAPEDIQKLLHDIGFGDSPGYNSWLRSALFAEWASRDLNAALAYVRDPQTEGAMYDSCLQQSFYAIFLGTRPDDPDEALAHPANLRLKHELGRYGNGTDWADQAHRLLFAELAAINTPNIFDDRTRAGLLESVDLQFQE